MPRKDGVRQCSRCNQNEGIVTFHKPSGHCVDCLREVAQVQNRRAADRLKKAKLDRKICAGPGKGLLCPFNLQCHEENTHWFDFDHRDPSEKTANLATFGPRSDEKFEAELAKCDMACAICHRERTKAGHADGSIKVGRPKSRGLTPESRAELGE